MPSTKVASAGLQPGAGGIAWQSSIVTAATLTAVANRGYWINTTSNACTITLPSSASVGDQLVFSDFARTWGTNAVTINQNSLNFQGNTSPNPIYNTSGQSVSIIYSGATKGWIPTSDDDVTNETPQTYSVDFLVIAGGGAGAAGASPEGGGGGGAGGYRNSYSSEPSGGGGSSEASLTFNPGTVYTITVGAGGAGVAAAPDANCKGIDSSISGTGITTITSAGGGSGRTTAPEPAGVMNGGSGGGGGQSSPLWAGGTGTANQGYNGGANGGGTNYGGGGGGGSGAIGGTSTVGNEGVGGAGLASSITGSSVTRGVGGNGGNGQPYGSPGNGTDATANTGNGGKGAYGIQGSYRGGNGGSGVLILRMPTANYSGTTTGSPTVTTSGADTILVYNASGSYTG